MQVIHDPLDKALFTTIKPGRFYITPTGQSLSIGFYTNLEQGHPETHSPRIVFQDDPIFNELENDSKYLEFKQQVLNDVPKILFSVTSRLMKANESPLCTNYVLVAEGSDEIESFIRFKNEAKEIKYRYDGLPGKLLCTLNMHLFI